jgi:hypothetical protein
LAALGKHFFFQIFRNHFFAERCTRGHSANISKEESDNKNFKKNYKNLCRVLGV